MNRFGAIVGALAIVAAIGTVAAVPLALSSPGKSLLEVEHMIGVSGAFLGSSMPLRGINGGGLPWVIADAEAKLSAGGLFEVEVRGLVIDPEDATAQERGVAGINPIPFFFATLSCLDSAGAVTNINTATVPASTSGDAEINEAVTLPTVCFAPIVFVRGSTTGASSGPWFAVSGF